MPEDRSRSPASEAGDRRSKSAAKASSGSPRRRGRSDEEEDPLDSFFSSAKGKDDKTSDKQKESPSNKADVDPDDPMADFFSSRPEVKEYEDPDEARRKRITHNNTGRSPPASRGRDSDRPAARRSPPRRSPRRSPRRGRRQSRRSRSYSRSYSSSRSRSGRGLSRSTRKKLDGFITENGLDMKIQGMLRKMDPEDAVDVMEQGFDLSTCRNANAVVVARINKLEKDTGRKIRPSPVRLGPGGVPINVKRSPAGRRGGSRRRSRRSPSRSRGRRRRRR